MKSLGIFYHGQTCKWKIKVKDKDGKVKQIPLSGKTEHTAEIPEDVIHKAQAIRAQYPASEPTKQAEINPGKPTLAYLFARHSQRLRAKTQRTSTHRSLDLAWRAFRDFAKQAKLVFVAEVTSGHIEMFVDDLLLRMKPSSAKTYLAYLSPMFETAIVYGWRLDNPCKQPSKRLPSPQSPEQRRKFKYYDQAEQEAYWHAIDEDVRKGKFDADYRDLIRLMFLTGLRVTQTIQLTFEDVDNDFVSIKPIDGNKTRTGYDVYLPREAQDIIARRKATLHSGRIFPTIKNCGQAYSRLMVLIRRHPELRSLKEKGRYCHSLRHTLGTNLSCKVPLEVIRDQLGHADIATTQIYARTTRAKIREAMQAVEL